MTFHRDLRATGARACFDPPLQQSAVFAAALRAMGAGATFRDLSASGRVIGRALVLSQRVPVIGTVRATLRGPLWLGGVDPRERAEALIGLNRAGLRLIEAAAPCPSLTTAGYVRVMTPASLADMPLRRTSAAWEAALHPKWRASLKQGRAKGPKVRAGRFAGQDAAWLVDTEARLRAERGYRTPLPRLATAIAATDPAALHLIAMHGTDGPIAAMLFVRHGRQATYLLGATTTEGRAARAHHVLLAEAARHLRDEGFSAIDLGTLDTEEAPGLARFKLGASSTLRTLGGSWLRLPFRGKRHRSGLAEPHSLR